MKVIAKNKSGLLLLRYGIHIDYLTLRTSRLCDLECLLNVTQDYDRKKEEKRKNEK